MRHISKISSFASVTLLTLILFSANSISAKSQTPEDYFVGGANLYINGDTESASNYVGTGLSKYPDDKKLQALKKAIEEDKKDKNQKENQNQDRKQDQNKDQQNNKDQQDQQKQQQPEKNQDQQQQQKDGYISKEDAQRLLDALANDEKNVQEKVKEAKAAKARVKTLINW